MRTQYRNTRKIFVWQIWIMYSSYSLIIYLVLRSLGYFSHTTIISRHKTYRQSYTLVISPSKQSLHPSSDARATVGTTATVRDLFSNYPVRRAASKTNQPSDLAEVSTFTIGIALIRRVTLSLRTSRNERLLRVDTNETKHWEKYILCSGLACEISSWITFEGELDSVRMTVRGCRASASRNYAFICTLSPSRLI
jgi:DNA mismatch repair ATPase MutL